MTKVSVFDLLREISLKLLSVCDNNLSADQEAWWVLKHVLNKDRTGLLLSKDIEVASGLRHKLDLILEERVIKNKPLAYILGNVPFCDLDILVRPPILIPRPETEEWVTWLTSTLNKKGLEHFSVLDLCCGSGCIGLAIAKAFNSASIVGVDILASAIQLSNENKVHNRLNNIEFIQSNLFDGLPKKFKCDVIISNPPYLSSNEYEELGLDVKLWEDKNALVADDIGMKFYKKILSNACKHLNRYDYAIPQIVLEIGPAQSLIEGVLQEFGYSDFEIYKDMQGRNRWIAIYLN